MIWKIFGGIAAAAGGVAAQKFLDSLWKTTTGTQPPDSPESPETQWLEALAWAAASGAVAGLLRVAATRQAAKAFVAVTGDLPKPMREVSKK